MRVASFKASMVLSAAILGFAPVAPAYAFQPVSPYLAMRTDAVSTIQPAAFPSQASITAAPVREEAALAGDFEAGAIVVRNGERKLYLSLGGGRALVYPVAIGKPGLSWKGATEVTAKIMNPSWTPTANIRRENPRLPQVIKAGPNNPLGPRALYLAKGYYRIHGTNKPSSIGSAASHGCIRMYNKDVVDLFSRVEVGARVVVLD